MDGTRGFVVRIGFFVIALRECLLCLTQNGRRDHNDGVDEYWGGFYKDFRGAKLDLRSVQAYKGQ